MDEQDRTEPFEAVPAGADDPDRAPLSEQPTEQLPTAPPVEPSDPTVPLGVDAEERAREEPAPEPVEESVGLPQPEPVDESVGLPPLEEITFEPSIASVSAITDDLEVVRVPTPQPAPPRPADPKALSKRRFATLAAFAEALIPAGGEIEWSAADVGVAPRLDAALTAFDPRARRRFSRALAFFEWSSVFSRHVRPFSKLPLTARLAVIDRAHRSRLPVRRAVHDLLKFYALNQWASTPRVEEAIGFTYSCVTDEPARDAERLEVLSYPQVTRDHTETCDVVVVGSGAGGSVVAKELAEVGLSVVVVEEGGSYARTDFTGPPFDRFLRLYRQQGMTAAIGTPSIPLPLGMAVGGSTVVNSGTCFRTPERVLARWERDTAVPGIDAESMRAFFERVERIQRVKPVPDELLGPNARVFRRGVDRLGLHGAPLLRTIEGCRGCGVCAFGCPSDAKLATHLTYLPRAQRQGATIYANARVDRILIEDGRARGVRAALVDPVTREPKASLTVRAKIVVIAAGAIHTPMLLARNALANRSGQLGRNLRIHPAAGVAAFFDEDIFGWRGTLQPYFVDDWHESHGLMIEVTSSVPSIGAGSMPGSGLKVKDLIARYRNLASAGLFVSDTSSGRVIARRDGEPLVTYRLNKPDTRRLVRGVAHTAEIFLAAGARAVLTGLPRLGPVTTKTQLEELQEEAVKPGALRLTAFHPVGTARMGADPATSVVGAWGEVHDVPGLFVADASVLPGCPGVNPQITIMAFATRTADHIVRHGARYF